MSEIYLSKDYYDKFLEFNITNFKRPNYKKRFEFQFFKNVYLENNSFPIAAITVNNLNEINGQFLVTPSKYVLNDLVKNCYFGSDYFVEENSRSSLAGFYLLKKVISDYSPQIAIGSTEVAIKILKLMHYPYIGNINKYFWFRKIPYRGLNKSKRKSEAINNFNYPDTLSIDNNKVHKYNFKDKISDYNVENIIFFERTPDFLKWRFSSELYGVYKIHLPENENNYFVVRVTNWKFLRLIILIDYRFDIRNVYVFGLMLKCCKKLAKIFDLDGVMIPSSYSLIDKELKKNLFIKIGNPTSIMTNIISDIFTEEKINKRDVIIATFADSDCDFNLGSEYI